MAYIFLDESGDLGFDFTKKKTQKFLLLLACSQKTKGHLKKL